MRKGADVLSAAIEDVNDAVILFLESPSMGIEVIEEAEMEPFMESIKEVVKGKAIALFGYYGWGDGEWMRNWEERMLGYGANLVQDSLIINQCPEGDNEIRCIEFGKSLI
ncbi:flavodoxin [Clostridiaceae bacterium UIB06]|uniref:Flavodoxin n=1 Tax=Clostridium thailandense TaxID=2794346 RepID=A0A949X1Q8_9CLOT|nr:flavodoxin [Clostridium thailandense]MBV7272389.1 flavodoxin [Clostridium thailandense]MCH5135898.1 flavodoxin [Clostridiaceae bacterium UIB06]